MTAGCHLRSLEEELAVLEALVDAAAGPGPISLFGASSGGGVASLFAARHPQRVERLVLYGTYARGVDLAPPQAREAMLAVVEQHWGLGSRVLADMFLPDATAEERDEFVSFQRRSASPTVALASLRAVYDFDSTGHLGDVLAPTLVLHRRADRAIPFALGTDVAARIRNASFVALEGDDHFPWRGDVDAVVRETLRFLGVAVALRSETRAGGGRRSRAAPHAREREVLRLVARGETDAEIAARLLLAAHRAPARREHPNEARRAVAHRRCGMGTAPRGHLRSRRLDETDAAGGPARGAARCRGRTVRSGPCVSTRTRRALDRSTSPLVPSATSPARCRRRSAGPCWRSSPRRSRSPSSWAPAVVGSRRVRCAQSRRVRRVRPGQERGEARCTAHLGVHPAHAGVRRRLARRARRPAGLPPQDAQAQLPPGVLDHRGDQRARARCVRRPAAGGPRMPDLDYSGMLQ